MAKKKKVNSVLEEQRRARQEFLELKKMQSGEIAPEPKPSETEIVPKTFSEKVQNYWYHYKWVTLIGFFIAVIFTICLVQCVTKVEPDLKIIVYGHTYIDDNGLSDLAEQYVTDLNGDGKVKVEIVNCSFNDGGMDLQYAYTMRQKVTCVLSEPTSLLFVFDQKGYDDYLANLNTNNALFEQQPVLLGKTFYTANETLPDGLLIACRNINASKLKKEKGIEKYYAASQKVLKALTADQP